MSWISCTSVCFMFFSKFFCDFCVFLFVLCFRLVYLSFCIYNRKTHKRKQNKQKYIISQPEPERYLLLSGRGLDILYFRFVFFSKLFCLIYVSFSVFLFSPSLFQLLHLQSTTKTHVKTYKT